MKKFKEGDIVRAFDGSYSVKISQDGRIRITGNVTKEDMEVIAINCNMPSDNENQRTDTILRSVNDGIVYFMQSDLISLVHRCKCPNCGQQL